jgi:hypothetical protein
VKEKEVAIKKLKSDLTRDAKVQQVGIMWLQSDLNGKTRMRNMRVERLLIVQDVTIITWILTMEKSSLSINIQQLKLKVTKII